MRTGLGEHVLQSAANIFAFARGGITSDRCRRAIARRGRRTRTRAIRAHDRTNIRLGIAGGLGGAVESEDVARVRRSGEVLGSHIRGLEMIGYGFGYVREDVECPVIID